MNSRSLDKFETFQSYEWVKKGNRTLEIGDTCSVWVNGKEATLTVAALGLMTEGKDHGVASGWHRDDATRVLQQDVASNQQLQKGSYVANVLIFFLPVLPPTPNTDFF